jgi:hypothetical protein
MFLGLLPIHPEVSPEREPHLLCYIMLKQTLFEIYSPDNTFFISNELKESEIRF